MRLQKSDDLSAAPPRVVILIRCLNYSVNVTSPCRTIVAEVATCLPFDLEGVTLKSTPRSELLAVGSNLEFIALGVRSVDRPHYSRQIIKNN